MADIRKRPVGRPRATDRVPERPAREAILLAGAELFAAQGFAGTTTREIAEHVGIRQPSLFYHFRQKQDILFGIIEAASSIWAEFLGQLEKRPGPAPVRLYELMRFDFLQLMTEPYGIGQLMVLPELRSGVFKKAVQTRRRRIISTYRKLIKQGIADQDFCNSDVEISTQTVFGMGEAIWSWYEPSAKKRPEQISEQIADLAMRSLLRQPGRLTSIKKAACH